jgi:WS/DGAT/MGAT family acyltransferase
MIEERALMQKLSFQDAAFFRMESANRPFHIGVLTIFSKPDDAAPDYLRKLAGNMAKDLLQQYPVLKRALADPKDTLSPRWTEVEPDLSYHLRLYTLPYPGRMQDLMTMAANAHAPPLVRSAPLWECHLIDGLSRNRFALYMKIHHALVDGATGIRMMGELMQSEPRKGRRRAPPAPKEDLAAGRETDSNKRRPDLMEQLEKRFEDVMKQGKALPEVASELWRMGWNQWKGETDHPPLPFTAPPTILNQPGSALRRLMGVDLPLNSLRAIGHSAGGTINDALIATVGGAVRAYLKEQNALPRSSLTTLLPVSIKSRDNNSGNTLSMIMCPMATNVADPKRRLQRIVKVTVGSKTRLQSMSDAGRQDMMNFIMLPVMALSMTHTTDKFRPQFNVPVSNVMGPKKALYLEDARMEAMYPLSLLSDILVTNFTAISYRNKLCIGLITCPDGLDDIDSLAGHLKRAHAELRSACLGK